MPRFSSKAEREQFWRRHLSQQSASGLTTRDYCRKHALQEPSFYSWRRTIRDRDRQPAPVARPTSDAPRPPAFLEGGRTTAVLYTMTQTCRRHGIDPFSYLQDVLTRLPRADYRELADLFPHRWAQARRAEDESPI